MADLIECPKCGAGFELSDVVRRHLEGELRAQLQGELQRELDALQKKLADASEKEAQFLRQRRELEERQQRLALDLEHRVAEETAKARATVEAVARERYERQAVEQTRAQQEELERARALLAEAAAKEAAWLRQQRELAERERLLAVELERAVASEGARVRAAEARLHDERVAAEREQQRLRDEEQRLRIDGLQRTIDELQRRAQQGSQQTQGEAQEARLRDLLAAAFPLDRIDEVAKGAFGADVLQRVALSEDRCAGTIIWESKRTKAWADEWLAKLRDDQRAAGAACAVIVTQALPDGVRHFAVRDDVWICAWPYAAALAAALRAGLIDVANARRAAEGRGEKMQLLYAYLTGTEFKNRVSGLVEAFTEMQDDLAAEKRALLLQWKKRERQLQRALENISAFYGDLQGIAGRQLSDLPLLTLPGAALPELDDAPAPEAPVPDTQPPGEVTPARADDDALADLLLAMVPADGGTIGTTALCAQWIERALTQRGVLVGEGDYERLKARLLVEGRLLRGRARGALGRPAVRQGSLL